MTAVASAAGPIGGYYPYSNRSSSYPTTNVAGGGGGGGGTLTLNAFSTGTGNIFDPNTTFNHTAGSGNNRTGVVACGSRDSGGFITSSWGGVNMTIATLTVRSGGTSFGAIYIATGIAAGLAEIIVNKSAGANIYCAAYDFYNADQVTGFSLIPGRITDQSAAGVSISTAATNEANGICVDAVAIYGLVTAMTTDTGQTLAVGLDDALGLTFASSYKAASAGVVAMGYDWTGAARVEEAVVCIKSQ